MPLPRLSGIVSQNARLSNTRPDIGVWESGPLPAPVSLIDPVSISVFIVPRSQYAQLNEARDKLTDLRVKNIFQRPQKAPSKGATASTFINDHKSNPCANVRRLVWPLTRSPGVVDLRISILILVNGLEVF
ncbi:hypothetical protein HHX47_DHR3001210 [Lentinula edodes]|nr:hypothetical protein HHX47_DHR3001210 [Lentinula edodes]